MADYWKSTPRYWCKHCSTYVKDTKFERGQHETTGRHQGNLKRFLRGIQNDHEKDEREKQRAKCEVERLNRAVGAPSASSIQGDPRTFRRATPSGESQTTVVDRKRQMAQLAEMGIAVPDEYRGEMALAGDWQVVSQKPVDLGQQAEEGPSLNVGVRKRKFEGQEEEEEADETVKQKGWGSTTKEYPSNAKKDLDALLAGSIPVKKEGSGSALKQENSDQLAADAQVCTNVPGDHDTLDVTNKVKVKQEDDPPLSALSGQVSEQTEAVSLLEPTEIVFKKRKSKHTRPK